MTDSLPSADDSLTGDPLLDLWPIFVPTSFFEAGNWPGPYVRCRIPHLGMTWAILSGHSMTYLDHDTARGWDQRGIRWREQALENVRAVVTHTPYTHEFRNLAGELYAIAIMSDDGVGPSRLLEGNFAALFPAGYLVGLPEMSCGLVVAVTARPDEMAKVADIARHCFEEGTRPLVPGLHAPEELAPL